MSPCHVVYQYANSDEIRRHLTQQQVIIIIVVVGFLWTRVTLERRISILVQRYNAVLLHDSLPAVDSRIEDWTYFSYFSFKFLLHVSIALISYDRFCLTVWPSVTRWYHAKTTPATIMWSSLEDSPMTLVSMWLTSAWNSKGNICSNNSNNINTA